MTAARGARFVRPPAPSRAVPRRAIGPIAVLQITAGGHPSTHGAAR